MLVPTDPFLLILTAIVLWSFWAACALRDRMTDRGGHRRDTMPSRAVGKTGLEHAPLEPGRGAKP